MSNSESKYDKNTYIGYLKVFNGGMKVIPGDIDNKIIHNRDRIIDHLNLVLSGGKQLKEKNVEKYFKALGGKYIRSKMNLPESSSVKGGSNKTVSSAHKLLKLASKNNFNITNVLDIFRGSAPQLYDKLETKISGGQVRDSGSVYSNSSRRSSYRSEGGTKTMSTKSTPIAEKEKTYGKFGEAHTADFREIIKEAGFPANYIFDEDFFDENPKIRKKVIENLKESIKSSEGQGLRTQKGTAARNYRDITAFFMALSSAYKNEIDVKYISDLNNIIKLRLMPILIKTEFEDSDGNIIKEWTQTTYPRWIQQNFPTIYNTVYRSEGGYDDYRHGSYRSEGGYNDYRRDSYRSNNSRRSSYRSEGGTTVSTKSTGSMRDASLKTYGTYANNYTADFRKIIEKLGMDPDITLSTDFFNNHPDIRNEVLENLETSLRAGQTRFTTQNGQLPRTSKDAFAFFNAFESSYINEPSRQAKNNILLKKYKDILVATQWKGQDGEILGKEFTNEGIMKMLKEDHPIIVEKALNLFSKGGYNNYSRDYYRSNDYRRNSYRSDGGYNNRRDSYRSDNSRSSYSLNGSGLIEDIKEKTSSARAELSQDHKANAYIQYFIDNKDEAVKVLNRFYGKLPAERYAMSSIDTIKLYLAALNTESVYALKHDKTNANEDYKMRKARIYNEFQKIVNQWIATHKGLSLSEYIDNIRNFEYSVPAISDYPQELDDPRKFQSGIEIPVPDPSDSTGKRKTTTYKPLVFMDKDWLAKQKSNNGGYNDYRRDYYRSDGGYNRGGMYREGEDDDGYDGGNMYREDNNRYEGGYRNRYYSDNMHGGALGEFRKEIGRNLFNNNVNKLRENILNIEL